MLTQLQMKEQVQNYQICFDTDRKQASIIKGSGQGTWLNISIERAIDWVNAGIDDLDCRTKEEMLTLLKSWLKNQPNNKEASTMEQTNLTVFDIRKKAKSNHFYEISKLNDVNIFYNNKQDERDAVKHLLGLQVLDILVLNNTGSLYFEEINTKVNTIEVVTSSVKYIFDAYDIKFWRKHTDEILSLVHSVSVEVKDNDDYDWFKHDHSSKLEEQVKYNIAVVVEEYCNVHYDNDDALKATEEQLVDRVYGEVSTSFREAGSCISDSRLRYFGKENIIKLTKAYLANYPDVQDFIDRNDSIGQLQPSHAEHLEYVNEKTLKELFK